MAEPRVAARGGRLVPVTAWGAPAGLMSPWLWFPPALLRCRRWTEELVLGHSFDRQGQGVEGAMGTGSPGATVGFGLVRKMTGPRGACRPTQR